jgi:membrane protein
MTSSIRSGGQNAKSIWKLGGLGLWQLVQAVLKDAQENELFERASGLAFDFLLALFPLLFILMALFDLFSAYSLRLRTSLLAYFADLLPTLAFQLLNRTTEEIAGNTSGQRLAIGLFICVWLVSSGVTSIISSLNAAFRIRESRSWFEVRAIAVILTLAISIFILSALGIVLVSGDFVDWLGRELQVTGAMIVIWKALQFPTAILFVIFSYALIYAFGPDLEEKRLRWITPGAVFGAFSWLIASIGFRVYLRFVNNYSVIFGSLGALVILLIWLYVTGLAFLIGGEINANIERAASEPSSD